MRSDLQLAFVCSLPVVICCIWFSLSWLPYGLIPDIQRAPQRTSSAARDTQLSGSEDDTGIQSLRSTETEEGLVLDQIPVKPTEHPSHHPHDNIKKGQVQSTSRSGGNDLDAETDKELVLDPIPVKHTEHLTPPPDDNVRKVQPTSVPGGNDLDPHHMQTQSSVESDKQTGAETEKDKSSYHNRESENVIALKKRLSSQNNTYTRPDSEDIKWSNTYWQVFYNAESRPWGYLYTAIYDDRDTTSPPFVRITGVGRYEQEFLDCLLWYEEFNEAVFVTPVVRESTVIKKRPIGNYTFQGFLYSCQLPVRGLVPKYVSIGVKSVLNVSTLLPVIDPIRGHIAGEFEHEFGMCVATTYGDLNVHHLIEWVEFNRILGVTEFSLTYYNITSPNAYKATKFYESESLLKLSHIQPVVQDDFGYHSLKLTVPPVLNDCMMRNMYRYRYMVVIDIDELIVPQRDDDFHQLIHRLEGKQHKKDKVVDFIFTNSFFDTVTDDAVPAYLRSMSRIFRMGYGVGLVKSIINPRLCLTVYNHYCFQRLYEEPRYSLNVGIQDASNHHYREEVFEQFRRKLNNGRKDYLAWKYKEQLNASVVAVHRELNIDLL